MRTFTTDISRSRNQKMKTLAKILGVYSAISLWLIILKISGFTDIRWIWILSPIWVLAVVTFIAVGFIFAVASITAAVDKFLDRDVSIPLKKWAYS